MNTEEVIFRPAPGTTCIAVPHGTDWGFDSLDPAGVEIKAYDGDYVWMLANRTHYITTNFKCVTFHPVPLQCHQDPTTTENWKTNGRVLYTNDSCYEFQHGNSYYVAWIAEHEMISNGVVTQAAGDVFIRSHTARRPIRFSASDALKSFKYFD